MSVTLPFDKAGQVPLDNKRTDLAARCHGKTHGAVARLDFDDERA
jgi:hypothetical protein